MITSGEEQKHGGEQKSVQHCLLLDSPSTGEIRSEFAIQLSREAANKPNLWIKKQKHIFFHNMLRQKQIWPELLL